MARKYYEEALQINQETLGRNHPDTALAYNNLGYLETELGHYEQARPYYAAALVIDEQLLGAHASTASDTLNLAQLEALSKKWEPAAKLADSSRRIVREYVARVLPCLSEEEQIVFLQAKDTAALHLCLAMGLAQRDVPEIARLSAGWLANAKGMRRSHWLSGLC